MGGRIRTIVSDKERIYKIVRWRSILWSGIMAYVFVNNFEWKTNPLGLLPFTIFVRSFADIVRNHTCHNRNQKGYARFS